MSSTTGNRSQISFPTTGITTKGQAMLLAIDDVSLSLKRNLCYYITKPSLHPEPVLTPSRDNPDALDYIGCHFYGAVLYEQGKFRMWYYPQYLGANPDLSPEQKKLTKSYRQTHNRWDGPVAYAESDDGIEWTKPNLGQLLFKGNRDNNGLDLPDVLIQGAPVIRDDDDPDPNRRYKMICNVLPQTIPPTIPDRTIRTATSPDGIHWTAGPQSCIGGDRFEAASLYKFNGLYFVNGQVDGVSNDGRTIGRSGFVRISTDFDHWLPESGASFWLPDPADAGKTVEHERRDEVHIGVGAAPLGNVLVGLYCIWHNDEDYGKISGDLGLVVSNDGIAFREPVKGYRWLTTEESPFTPVPGKNYPTILCQGNGILNVGDETRIYYGRWRNVGDVGQSHHNPELVQDQGEICLATLPRDRWGALGLTPASEHYPAATEGTVWSAPVRLPEGGCEVALNADGADGMRVEVGNERFELISGFCGEDSDADPRLYVVYLTPNDI